MDEIISSSKEEMGKAIEKLRQDNELRIKSLEEQHSKKQVQLKSKYEEKMILFSSSSVSRAPTCTVSESQLRQSLNEAKEEIQALKEQKKQMVCVQLRRFLFAPCRCVLYAVSEISRATKFMTQLGVLTCSCAVGINNGSLASASKRPCGACSASAQSTRQVHHLLRKRR